MDEKVKKARNVQRVSVESGAFDAVLFIPTIIVIMIVTAANIIRAKYDILHRCFQQCTSYGAPMTKIICTRRLPLTASAIYFLTIHCIAQLNHYSTISGKDASLF
ncbi:hypothetical protein DINM_004909 [Dirofilaria immitis]|nr:hypothetical protein [Dirofilaria immitis]